MWRATSFPTTFSDRELWRRSGDGGCECFSEDLRGNDSAVASTPCIASCLCNGLASTSILLSSQGDVLRLRSVTPPSVLCVYKQWCVSSRSTGELK